MWWCEIRSWSPKERWMGRNARSSRVKMTSTEMLGQDRIREVLERKICVLWHEIWFWPWKRFKSVTIVVMIPWRPNRLPRQHSVIIKEVNHHLETWQIIGSLKKRLKITGDWKLKKSLGYRKGFRISRDWTKNERSITVKRPLNFEISLVPPGNEMMTEWKWGKFLEYVIFQRQILVALTSFDNNLQWKRDRRMWASFVNSTNFRIVSGVLLRSIFTTIMSCSNWHERML